MDKENGENTEGGTNSSKLSNPPDPSALLDAASLFGYWPRGDATSQANAANLFAAAGSAYGLAGHPSLQFGLLPPGAGRSVPPYTSSTTASAAYNNAYTNTLSVAASQAASLGIPAASAAWWSMASHLAAQDYLARLQASGLTFPSLSNPADLPYSPLGLSTLSGYPKSTKSSKSSALPKSQQGSSKTKVSTSSSSHGISSNVKTDGRLDLPTKNSSPMPYNKTITSNINSSKYASSSTSIPIQSNIKLSNTSANSNNSERKTPKVNDLNLIKSVEKSKANSASQQPISSIFTNPLSMASNVDKNCTNTTTSVSSIPSSIPTSILSDPNTILGGVRLPPDTEIIKYTSSIVGPKIPGTTNRGRKKTISLDPPSVSVHPSLSGVDMHLEKTPKRQKLNESQEYSNATGNSSSDRVEVIKLAPTNGSPGIPLSNNTYSDMLGDAPLNLSMKPNTSNTTNLTSSSLNSLSNMSANIGMDRISRRKPGPKPRKIVQPPSHLPPGAPSASLQQLFASADSPRPPSRNEEGINSSSTTTITSPTSTTINSLPMPIHKDGRPRNLGRGISKPKKNTVASLLAQSRALGIKPMPMLDPNASMNQQISLLKSNILAAQQLMAEAGGDEKMFNKLLQEKFRGALSDSNSSTVDASTDSDNLTDSNHTDSEMEIEPMVATKKPKQFDINALRLPLDKGWKRETIIRGLGKNGNIKGDVTYVAQNSLNQFKQMSDITQYLDFQVNSEFTKENFTFSSRIILGDYLQPVPSGMTVEGGEFIRLTEDDVKRRLDELKSAARTNLAVEQRIVVARRQQAARAQARMEKEQARLQREMERSERQEAARREREARSQQLVEERELKRQQAAILKEQERERRRQHMALVKALESRRKLEERERKKQQVLAEKQASKEKKLEQRRMEMEILTELRKPCEDLELNQRPLPKYDRIPGLKLPGKAFSDVLMVFEFLHNFGETLGFDMESLPTLDSLQQALLYNNASSEAEEELLSVMTHLLVCAIEDPGIPNPARHTTSLGQTLRQADITHTNLSEILRIYLYANATGEVKALSVNKFSGVHFERDRDRRVADHHQSGCEMQETLRFGKNVTYYELLHENQTWKMSDMLKDKPFLSLNPTNKAGILAYLCNELLQNKAVIRQIDSSLEGVTHLKKERWIMEAKIRKLRILHGRKVRSEAVEKAHNKPDSLDVGETAVDSPALHKDDLLDDDENDMSEIESVGTQPEEEEDNKLSGEEMGKKLEKLMKQSEAQLQSLNCSAHQLRATCFGQDRYWRRYWSLPKAGGIFIESMESADPEILLECQKEDLINPPSETDDLQLENDTVKMIENQVNNAAVSAKENSEIPDNSINLLNENEHRKTPNRLEIAENGDMSSQCEQSLDELRKSVEKIVQSLDSNTNQGINCNSESHDNSDIQKMETNHVCGDTVNKCDEDDIKLKVEPCEEQTIYSKKLNIFEKLGECMERENKTEEELKTEVKAEIKEELKNEILNELKFDIKCEFKSDLEDEKSEYENKWFSILSKEGTTCEGSHLTQGNRWENGVGVCSRENITELKIPVFPPPNSSSSYMLNSCDSPGPLQMTPEESVQLEYIKKHGLPKPCERKSVPLDKRYGWWRITDIEQLKAVLDNLHVRGARERELKRTFLNIMQSMYERQGKLHIEEGQIEATILNTSLLYDGVEIGGAPQPDESGNWSSNVARRVDNFLFEQVEALEDKVANASMQIKGWRIPSREIPEEEMDQIVELAKNRLLSLEAAIERRYLKPPLGISTGDPNLAAIAQESAGGSAPTQANNPVDDVPKGLSVWREALNRSQTSAQLAMCLYTLEASIAWDKSIMKANCQFCQNGDNEDKLLLCDGCDKGYHTYCFKPKMENIPEGDWYCHECMNKATNERNCIVCGKKQSTSGTRLLLCEICPRAYHTDCVRPPLTKTPRGKWYCSNCISKKPQKRAIRKNNTPKAKEGELVDIPPASPAPSHSSATTNEDQLQVTDLNNLSNASSPSTQTNRKEKVSKKLLKELAPCKAILEDLECHDDAWPFLLPVNTKQFPTYKKIIKTPMDLSSIKKRLQDVQYKSKEEFCADVRQIFNNCETFNEDDSPVGKAGHCMRQFFEARWNDLCLSNS